ncbi:MAG TPA: Arm DNA-binding domain-containing protein, partial [Casimicrobiaceae bacterium]|nr:Arm DNA-binding domain-containing protein [Casimicrobiaceae bacterium]
MSAHTPIVHQGRPLTVAAIQALRPGHYLADANERGLRVVAYLQRKAFLYRYRGHDGRLRQVTIGDAKELSIAEARGRVRGLRQARSEGRDPRHVQHEAVAEVVELTAQTVYTVGQLIADYAAECLARTKGGAERLRALRHDVRHWERREAAGVTRAEVKALIADVALRTPDTAGRVLRELRAAYAHALDRERIPDSADPTAHVKPPKESRYVPRDRAFTAAEWRGWLQWLPTSGM